MRGGRTAVALAVVMGAAFGPALARAAAPPNPHDPCVQNGRDSCGTAGVGFYRTSRYGLRWFGDYRGAVPGAGPAFCVDLGYWYAARFYAYRRESGVFRSRTGHAVSLENRRRMAYAVWRYGRSTRPNQQAAVMLYVHSLVGDGRPGELDPAALGHAVDALYRQIARDSARLHGPYKIETNLPSHLLVDRASAATVRVVSAHGVPVRSTRVLLAARGATGLPTELQTDDAGLVRFELTPTTATGLQLHVTVPGLASAAPHVFAPTSKSARQSGQRLVVPASDRVTANVVRLDVGVAPRVTARVSAPNAVPGARVSDVVSVTGLSDTSLPVHVELWGPFPTRAAIRCSGTPYWTTTFTANGDSTTTTSPVELERAGYYAYQETIRARPPNVGYVSSCASTTTFAKARPSIVPIASEQIVRPGSHVTDRFTVQGLDHTPARVEVELFGPFASRSAARCDYRLLHWRSRLTVPGDTRSRTPGVTVARPGFYAYRERVLGTPLVAGTTASCARPSQTVFAAPEILTGRGDVTAAIPTPGSGGRTPARVRIRSLGIDAPVSPSGIDLRDGLLGIPSDIQRIGWWRDGTTPGAREGAVLLAGHVDSAKAGKGAFFSLAHARPGALVELSTLGGRTFTYRISSVRTYSKRELPTNVYSRLGRPRLVLVTCGGRFNTVTGHYPDDVVVTATPV